MNPNQQRPEPSVQVAASVTRYQSCTVDLRPGRVVHCPDLNACLVNEGRTVPVDCRAVHFGYAIPVNVVPLDRKPDLAELVLDSGAELTPEAVNYLLHHHPQLRESNNNNLGGKPSHPSSPHSSSSQTMATKSEMLQASPGTMRNKYPPGGRPAEPDTSAQEDIAAIAKQISDHAEAIYQTWKSRGLSPTEILNCHASSNAVDKLGSALTPQPKGASQQPKSVLPQEPLRSPDKQPQQKGKPISPVDLLTAPVLEANLEELVNNFVVEDKARLAARQKGTVTKTSPRSTLQSPAKQNNGGQSKNLPSSIQFALQKFEKKGLVPEANKPKSPPAKTITDPIAQYNDVAQQRPVATAKSTPSLNTLSTPTSKFTTPDTTTPARNASKVSPVTILSTPGRVGNFAPSQNIQTALTPQGTLETTFAVQNQERGKKKGAQEENSGMTTWPLKAKGGEKRTAQPGLLNEQNAATKHNVQNADSKRNGTADLTTKYATMPAKTKDKTAAYLAEVDREEEKLINALKTGMIIAEDTSSDKSSLFLKKSKDKEKTKKVKATKQVTSSSPADIVSNGVASPVKTTQPDKSPKGKDEKEVSMDAKDEYERLVEDLNNLEAGMARASSPGSTNRESSPGSKSPKYSENLNMSLVDYAKVRYQAAQQYPLTQQRLEDAKQLDRTKGGPHTVSETRTRFEAGQSTDASFRSEWVPGRFVVDESGALNPADFYRRKAAARKSRKALSPEPVPHPELTTQQKQHIRERSQTPTTSGTPVRPFLTRGSVAERVLIFEKCPTELPPSILEKRKAPAISTWRSGNDVQSKAQTYARDKENRASPLSPSSTLQRQARVSRNVHIPRFHFPKGRPINQQQLEMLLQKVAAAFKQFPNQQVPREKFSVITKACDCPLYWKVPLFIAAGGEKVGYVSADTFLDFWKKVLSAHHDAESRFVYILTRSQRQHLLPDDFIPLVQDVVETHPGLTFLKEATEFHSRYVHTVIARIYYCVNRSWSGRITIPELRKSNLLRVIQLLEDEEDINQVTDYFSYEHFYVIYCKFWELDKDHDLYIDKQDLTRHNDHALSSRMIDRIFSGAVTRGKIQREDKMSYTEFVWFLISEEDKNHATAIEYWFRCMDLDGDGFLSMYELEYFYEEQLQRMEALGIETLPFEDCLCQMLDMIRPGVPGKISLSDLKKCKMTSIFYDTFFNLEKFLDHEQRDPFASQREHDGDGQELSDWDRYAAEEYELLVAEEGGSEQQEELGYEEEMETEDAFSPNLDNIVTSRDIGITGQWVKPRKVDFDMDDDSADYADSDECSV